MKFDIVIGNPPYNSAKSKNPTNVKETGLAISKSNRTLYKTFTKYGMSMLNEGGYLSYVTLKSIYISFFKDKNLKNYHIHYTNMMENTNYWKYNTCHFLIQNTNRINPPQITNKTLSKFIDVNNTFQSKSCKYTKKQWNKFKLSNYKTIQTPYRVITNLPGKETLQTIWSDNPGYGYGINKLVYNIFPSWKSLTQTSFGIFGEHQAFIETKTIKQAKNLKILVNSDIIWGFVNMMNFKPNRGLYDLFRFLKYVDLDIDYSIDSNIIKVFNLDKEDLKELSNFK